MLETIYARRHFIPFCSNSDLRVKKRTLFATKVRFRAGNLTIWKLLLEQQWEATKPKVEVFGGPEKGRLGRRFKVY